MKQSQVVKFLDDKENEYCAKEYSVRALPWSDCVRGGRCIIDNKLRAKWVLELMELPRLNNARKDK